MEIINNNKNTVYGREFSFESIKSGKDFMETHPLTTKSHYKEYVGKCGVCYTEHRGVKVRHFGIVAN